VTRRGRGAARAALPDEKPDAASDDGGIIESMQDGWQFTVREYVRLEAASELVKHEFDDGQIRAMSGGTTEHARLAIALAIQVGMQLQGRPCAIYSADSRVRIANLITYPDLSIGCHAISMDIEDKYAQLNPCVLVEITSKSSERYDRGKKWDRYKQIPSLRDYVIVSHREHAIDVFSRADGEAAWGDAVTYRSGQIARLPSLAVGIDVDALYRDPRKPRD
jgi:Uma2 family endonuclease